MHTDKTPDMKTALVTGATKGIGLAIARMLLREGYYVVITYAHDEAAATRCCAELEQESPHFELIRADQGEAADRAALVARLRQRPTVDCLVFNAGITLRKGLQDFTDAEWERVLHVNVSAPVFLLRDLFDRIPGGSRIIFIGSQMGIHPHGTSLAYGVSKSAVHALSCNLVKFFEGTGTTVNTIAPGFVETEWQKDKPEDIRRNICAKTALHRFATVDEIADAVRFCLNNPFVNGSVIEVNGGYCYR